MFRCISQGWDDSMKKMIYLLSCLLMVFTLTNCTSNNTDESGDEVASEESFGEESSDDVTSEDGEAVAEDSGAVTEEGGDEGFGDESLPTEEVAETVAPAEGTDPSLDQPADTMTADASTEVQPTESIDNAGVDLGTPPDAMVDGTTDTAMTEAPTPELQSSESTESTPSDSFASAPSESFSNEEAPKPVASLKKVELAPFNRAGQLLNAVYVSRPGDDFTTISQMIYGSPDKAENLKQANAWITTLRPGDKVYYNSPMRPTDSSKLLTFYEEQGVPSEVYTVGAGEDLKAVSAKLLGYPNAWKEVWATNLDIESKGELSEGTQLRYWKNAGNFAAQANQPPAPTAEVAANMPPPPMPEEFAQTEMPPPPPMDAMNPPPPDEFAQMEMPPPPPMMEEASLPPPPQQPAPAAVASMDEESAGVDNDMMMNLGGAAIAAAALGAFVMIRRKKSREKEIAQAFDSTQVG